MKFDSYSISRNGLEGICKSPVIWGHRESSMMPLVYLRKPKWMTEEDFYKVVDNLTIHLPKDLYEVRIIE